MAVKIDDLFYSLKIDDSGITAALNKAQADMKKLNNEIINLDGVIDKDKLVKPFSMQAMTIQQAINQAKLLEQAYKKIEFPHLDKEAELLRQRWQEIQAQVAQYGIVLRSSAMEIATTSAAAERELNLRKDVLGIIEKSNLLQSDTSKKIISEQLALSQLRNERAKLSEAESKGLISADNLMSAKARITEQEKQHKIALQQLEFQLANEVKAVNTASGSMNELSARLNKLKADYRALSQAAREGSVGKQMLKDITDLDVQLKKMDAGIGNYGSAYNGLSLAIQQVGRELPSLKMGFGMFMLAISNNLPILSDELGKAREKYKALVAKGEEAIPVWRQVISSIVSWQTVMVVAITVLTMYGKEIANWVSGLFKARDAVKSLADMQDSVNKEMFKSSGYGEQITKLRDLQAQWESLGDSMDKKRKFVEDNKSAFDELNVSVSNVSDAEGVLVTNTSSVIDSLRLRAQATAAYKLASEQYEVQMQKQLEAEKAAAEAPTFWDKFKASAARGMMAGERANVLGDFAPTAEEYRQKRIEGLIKEADAAGEAAEAYMTLGEKAIEAAGGWFNPNKDGKGGSTRGSFLYDELKNLREIQNIIRQSEINLMQEGSEKTLAQMKFNHDKKMQQLEDQKNEELRKIIEVERQKFEANPANKGKTFDSKGVSLSDEQLALYSMAGQMYNREYQAQQAKFYADALNKYKTYQEARLEILKRFQSDRELLISQGASESKLNELNIAQEKALDEIDKTYGEREAGFKYWANSIANISLEQLVDMLGQAQAKLAIARMQAGTGKDMGDDSTVAMYRAQILALQEEIEKLSGKEKKSTGNAYRDWKRVESVLNSVGKELENIGKEIGGTIGEFISAAGVVATSTASIINGITSLTETSADAIAGAGEMAEKTMTGIEKASVILRIISAALKVIDVVKDALDGLKDRERDREEYLRGIIELQHQYNLSLIESKLLQDEVFGTDSLGGMFDAMEALAMAVNAYNKALNETQTAWKDPSSNFFDKLYKYGTIMGWFGDSTVGSAGTTSLRNNLRYITKKSSSGFFGIGGSHTKTEDLESWVKSNLGEDLFLEDGRLNLEVAVSLVEGSSDRLAGTTKESLETLIELEKAAREAESAMKDYISNTFGELGDAISDNIVNAFRNGTDAAIGFKESVGGILEEIGRQVVRNMFIGEALKQLEKDVYPIYERFGKDGDAGAFANNIVGVLDAFINNAESGIEASNMFLQSLKDQAAGRGIDIFQSDETADKGGKGLESGYARASQESISELTGATYATQSIMSDLRAISATMNTSLTAQTHELKQQTMVLNSINRYSQEIRDFNTRLPIIADILDKTYRNGLPIRD